MMHIPDDEYELIKRMQQAKSQAEHDELERELELLLENKKRMTDMIVLSKCGECKHFLCDSEGYEPGTLKCKAFPNGIPFEVFKSNEDVQCTKEISFEPEEVE